MPPGRRRTGSPPMHLTIVDSMPTAHGPPSSTMATRPESLSRTWLAKVGLIAPEGLALGATIGLPLLAMSVCATSWEGTLSAIEARPAEASIDTGQSALRGTTSVKGPGQNARARRSASLLKTPSACAWAKFPTWAISGLNFGRPFAA